MKVEVDWVAAAWWAIMPIIAEVVAVVANAAVRHRFVPDVVLQLPLEQAAKIRF